MTIGNRSTSSHPKVEPSLLVRVKSESPLPQVPGHGHESLDGISTNRKQEPAVATQGNPFLDMDFSITDEDIRDSAHGLLERSGYQVIPPGNSARVNQSAANELARETRRISFSSSTSSTSENSEEPSERAQSSRNQIAEGPSCGEELEAAWQTLRTGFRGLETVHLTISAMNITAGRAADKVRAQNILLRDPGDIDTISHFQARRYLRRTRSLLRQVERTMKMLVREEPRLLQAIYEERKRHNRITRMARRTR